MILRARGAGNLFFLMKRLAWHQAGCQRSFLEEKFPTMALRQTHLMLSFVIVSLVTEMIYL
ncbi:hypothetical protein A3716_28950 [Alcanivorax sp. HI0011]|nr:hypothetical protein A3716_28950 [Alcanivorax sp. HI0011]